MTDPDNVIVNKIFTVENKILSRLGHKSLAVNKNYIIHLLEDYVTGQ